MKMKPSASSAMMCSPGGHHKASTFEIDKSVRESAIKLRDTAVLARLAGGDMVAIEAEYHVKCLAALSTEFESYKYKHLQQK